MGVEANIQPLRIYNNMFPDRLLEDGTPDPKYLQSTHIMFECYEDSIISSLGCINLEIASPNKKLVNSQFILTRHHNQIPIGAPFMWQIRSLYSTHTEQRTTLWPEQPTPQPNWNNRRKIINSLILLANLRENATQLQIQTCHMQDSNWYQEKIEQQRT